MLKNRLVELGLGYPVTKTLLNFVQSDTQNQCAIVGPLYF